MSLDLQILGLAGPICAVVAERGWRGRELKEAIAKQTQIPISKMKLLRGTTLIRNVDVLGEVMEGEVELMLVRQAVDFDYWLDEISKDYRRLRRAPPELRADREVVLEAMKQSPEAIKFAAESAKADRTCAKKALEMNWRLYSFIDLDLWDDREIVMLFVPFQPSLYGKLCMDIKKDRELAKLVLEQNNGWMLDSMPRELQRDKEVVLLAARNATQRWADWSLLRCVDRALLADKEVVMACARAGNCHIADLQQELSLREFKGDLEVLRAVVEGNPMEIAHVPDLQNDKDFAVLLLHKEGLALQFLPGFCEDRACVEAAVAQNPAALRYASLALRNDRALAQLAIRGLPLLDPGRWTPRRVRGVVYNEVHPEEFLLSLSKDLRGDKELMLEMVQMNGRLLCVVEEELLADREVVSAALWSYPRALQCLQQKDSEAGYPKRSSRSKKKEGSALLEDLELLVQAVRRDRSCLQFCPRHLKEQVEAALVKKRG